MKTNILLSAALFGFTGAAFTQPLSSCQAVYAGSIRNVDTQSRILAEQNEVSAEHCEVNGAMKSTSANVDLRVPIQKVVVGFTGSQTEAREEMQKFCKSYASRSQAYQSYYQTNSQVVVDALRSYNQCINLERRGVQISHAQNDTQALVVKVGFNPAEANVTLNSVHYEPSLATCRSTVHGGSRARIVNSTMGRIVASGPFSVSCDRIGVKLDSGETRFSRFELLVDTNQGAYTVTMPTEGALDYDLANRNRVTILALQAEAKRLEEQVRLEKTAVEAEKAKAIAQVASLTNRMSRVEATLYEFTRGENEQNIPCSVTELDHAQAMCRDAKISNLIKTKSHGGGRCGYSTWIFTCVRIPPS